MADALRVCSVLVIEGFASSHGDYSVDMICPSAFDGEITCGHTVNGTTTGSESTHGNEAPDHFYSFTVQTAGIVQFDSCASSYDTWLRVFATDMSTELHSCDDCGPCGTRTVLDAHLDAGD